MTRVSKGLMVLMVAGLLLGVGGKAQAVIGVPDDVPGSTLLFPFFKVDPTPTAAEGRQDTLIVITNTAAASPVPPTPNTFVHIVIWSVRSLHVYDFTITLTPHDVFPCSLYDLLVSPPPGVTAPCGPGTFLAPPSVARDLTVTVGGQTILAGYITADVVSTPATFLFPGQAGYPFLDWNTLVGHMYLVNLAQGSASGFNAVSIESVGPTFGHPAVPAAGQFTGFYQTQCILEQGGGLPCASPALALPRNTPGRDFRERIDGPNGDIAQTFSGSITVGGIPNPGGADSPLGLILRYFSAMDLRARTEVWLWKDRNTPGVALNIAVYDEAENAISILLNVPDEVNFLGTEAIITPGVPGGWFRVKLFCSQFGSCSFNPLAPGTSAPFLPPIQSVAYAVQFAQSQDATLRWDATFPAHRQYTNYIPSAAFE